MNVYIHNTLQHTLHVHPIPSGVTFSKTFWKFKLKARTSLFTEMWQKRHSSCELWALKELKLKARTCLFTEMWQKRHIELWTLERLFSLKCGKRDTSSSESSNVSFHWNVAKETFELWKLERLFSPKCGKRDIRALKARTSLFTEMWQKRHSNSESSNVSFYWNVAKETFELWALSCERAVENVTPDGIGCTCNVCCNVLWMYTFIHGGRIAIHNYYERMRTFTMVHALCMSL